MRARNLNAETGMNNTFVFITVVQALVATALVGVILMQRSEGGGLGVGGSPSGLMSARGAADFLTRATTVLATLFVALSILLAVLAVGTGSSRTLDTSLQSGAVPASGPASAPVTAPVQTLPVDPGAGSGPVVSPSAASRAAPATAPTKQ
jgi:preprotein translocase subunit SecG